MLKSEKSVSPSLEVSFKKKFIKKKGMLKFGSLRSRLLRRGIIREKKNYPISLSIKIQKIRFSLEVSFKKKKFEKRGNVAIRV